MDKNGFERRGVYCDVNLEPICGSSTKFESGTANCHQQQYSRAHDHTKHSTDRTKLNDALDCHKLGDFHQHPTCCSVASRSALRRCQSRHRSRCLVGSDLDLLRSRLVHTPLEAQTQECSRPIQRRSPVQSCSSCSSAQFQTRSQSLHISSFVTNGSR